MRVGKSRGDCFTVSFQNTVRINENAAKRGRPCRSSWCKEPLGCAAWAGAAQIKPLNERQLFMEKETKDSSLLEHIQHLASEEHRLFAHPQLSDVDRARLAKINVELDQCGDRFRHRQPLL